MNSKTVFGIIGIVLLLIVLYYIFKKPEGVTDNTDNGDGDDTAWNPNAPIPI